VAEPTPGPDEAVVRVRHVGICGTDTKIHAGHIPVDYPRIMGHEIVGTVEAAPPEAAALLGERVLVDPGITCGDCPQCRAGRGNICTRGWLLGRDRDGGLRDRMQVPAANLHPVPDGIADVAAPILQVLATCIHGQRLAPPTPGDTVAIFGLGVTGLLHLQLAKAAGASPVICATRSAEKLDLARRLGAESGAGSSRTGPSPNATARSRTTTSTTRSSRSSPRGRRARSTSPMRSRPPRPARSGSTRS
jgi:threonine dehydrogenase-like Zn-dependent dehydrogenase